MLIRSGTICMSLLGPMLVNAPVVLRNKNCGFLEQLDIVNHGKFFDNAVSSMHLRVSNSKGYQPWDPRIMVKVFTCFLLIQGWYNFLKSNIIHVVTQYTQLQRCFLILILLQVTKQHKCVDVNQHAKMLLIDAIEIRCSYQFVVFFRQIDLFLVLFS